MKIFIAKYEPDRLGGGWSFQRNFAKAMKDNLSSYEEADVFFIASASMLQREEVEQAKKDGKKIVLRVDNIIRNSRNRNTGMSRMKDFAQMADLVVYQSKWAGRLLHNFLSPKNSVIILNGTDQDIFNTEGRTKAPETRYLYSKYSSDETKNWELARSSFQQAKSQSKILNIVGRYDAKMVEYNFDFYEDEEYVYHGEVQDIQTMADIYKSSDVFLYSYFNDACSQTLIEAISCGLEIYNCYGMLQTGGAREIMEHFNEYEPNYFALPRMGGEYFRAMSAL